MAFLGLKRWLCVVLGLCAVIPNTQASRHYVKFSTTKYCINVNQNHVCPGDSEPYHIYDDQSYVVYMGFPPMKEAPALMPKWKWNWASLSGSQDYDSFHLDEDYCVRPDPWIDGNPFCVRSPIQCMDPTKDGDQVNPYYHRWDVPVDKVEVTWKEPMREDETCPGWRVRYGQPGQKHDSDGRVVSILPSDTYISSDSPALSIEALSGITVPNDSSADPVVLPAPVLIGSTLNNNNGDTTGLYDTSGNLPGSNIFGTTPLDLTPPAAQPQLQSTPIQSPFWTFGKRTRKLKRQSPRDFR